jgi:hypothetical protein
MISRGQMYRQLYMGGGQGITSLDAGAPSIKYTGDIKPQMASAPDPMAELYNIFLDLKQQGQIPKEMGFEQFKQLMEEQSSSQGGIMDMVPREQALFGGRVNYGLGSSFKKAVKKVTGAVKDVVKSDLGKAALAGAALYYGGGGNLFGLQRAGLSGFSFNNIPGVLKARNFLQGVPLGDGDPRSGGILSRIGKECYLNIWW